MQGPDHDEAAPLPELDAVYSDRLPPPYLEDRVVEALVQDRLIDLRRPPKRDLWLPIAASIVFFLLGLTWGSRARTNDLAVAATPVADEITGPAYMLLLYEGPDFGRDLDAESVAASYAAWGRAVAETGVRIQGNELSLTRETVGVPSDVSEAMLGGYFLVDAPTGEAARGIAEGHPHLANGGWIEVVQVMTR